MNILPWLIAGEGEYGKETAREAELALVLAAVEQERDKGGGILKRKNPESISSVSQLFWPLYLIKQSDVNRYIIFDGLGLFEHVLEYQTLPQLDSFEKHLAKNTPSNVTLDDYLAFLSSNIQVFANLGDLTQQNLVGCIGQEELIKDLTNYFQASAHINTAPEAQFTLRFPPDLANKQISILAEFRNSARIDIQHLEEILNKLADTAKQWTDYLESQQFEVAESFNKQIESVSHDIEPKIQNYNHLMQEELRSIEISLSPLISNLHAEVSRWEREEERWNNLGDRYSKSRNSAKAAKNKAKQQLNNAIKERENSIDKAKTYYSDLIKEEQEKLISLENERDEKQKTLKANEDEITHLTSKITESLST